MIIRIGTENQNKIEGVRHAFAHYYKPEELTLMSIPITIEEFGHPRNIKETVDGAIQRAKKAFGPVIIAGEYPVDLPRGMSELRYLSADLPTGRQGPPCAKNPLRYPAVVPQGRVYSVGIESGLIEVPHTKTGYMETVICALYDGKNIFLGLAPAFEWPPAVARMILEQGLDGSQAMREAGVTHHEKLGAVDGGALGLLSKGATDRVQQVELAVLMALVHIIHPKLYQP